MIQRTFRWAFTLIGLMVVIAITAVLLPAIQAAMNGAEIVSANQD